MNTFLGKQFESNGEKRRIWRTARNLSPSHVIDRPITIHCEDSDKSTLFGELFTDPPTIDILYYPEERDDKGELIKAGHYVLLRRATLLCQPENELTEWVIMLLFAQKQMIGLCV